VTATDDRTVLGVHGEPCTTCGTPLARDQRYCLACGARRTGLSPVLTDAPLVAWSAVSPGQVAAAPVGPPPPVRGGSDAAAPPPGPRWAPDAALLAGAACLLLALLIGVLIGRAGHGTTPQAPAPQVITVGGGAAAPAATPTAVATATPTAAPSETPTATPAATAKPATKEEKQSAKALQDLQGASGDDYSKKSAKLPKTIVSPGKPPKKDTSKPAGGGSGTETFK
jgi:hypothetical protein